MLGRLAVRNVKRSAKDYVIYFITVVLAFSFLFAFNLLGSSSEILELSDVMNNFAIVMHVVNIFILFVVCFLINYTIKFMFSKRSLEFGTYLLLGIKKKQISNLFTLENVLLGLLTLPLAIFIGYILSLLMSFIITGLFELESIVHITFFIEAVLLLFVYFAFIYVFVLFLARRRIRKVKIYDLLYFEKKNEEKQFRKNKVRNVSFFVSLGLGILAMALFFQEFHRPGVDPSMATVLLCIVLIIFSIYGVVITLADFLLKVVLKNKKLKYQKDYLFLVRTFSSKVKTMSFTLGTISVLITFTLIALNLSSLFKAMFDYQLELSAPYDISVTEIDENEIPLYLDFIKEHYTIEEEFVYHGYTESNRNVSKVLGELGGWREYDQFVKLSDYNKLLELKGDKSLPLEQDEYLIHATREFEDILTNTSSIQEIILPNDEVLKLKDVVTDGYTYAWGTGYGFLLVVPDDAVEGLAVESTNLIVDTKEETTEEFAKVFERLLVPDICEEEDDGYTVCYSLANVTVRRNVEATNNGFITIVSFVCFYIAFIFISVVGTILAIQGLSDSSKYKYRYQVLSKLGVKESELDKTIFRQLFVFFLFPVIYPIIISFFTVFSLNHLFQFVLTTDTVYILYYFINLLVFLLIYIIYFLTTYFGFKRNIGDSQGGGFFAR